MRIATAVIGAGAAGTASILLGATEAAASLAAVLGGVTAWFAVEGREDRPPRPALPEAVEVPPASIADLIEALDDPMLVIAGQRVTLANAAALQLLGDHIIGEDVRLAIRHPATAERILGGDQPASGSQMFEMVGLGDRDRHWEVSVHRLKDGSSVVRLVDRTGFYATERMRVDFVANASHELRTPLATLIGFIETLEEAGDEPDTRARFLTIMAGEARRMQQLVADLMSLSRIEAEKYSLPQQPVSLPPLVAEARDALSAGVAADKSRVQIEIAPDTPEAVGDRAQLSQLIHNLIANALKYGRAGGRVLVKIAPAGKEMVRLSVADEGEGIAPEHLPRLTERFYRVDPSRSRAAGGTGLGLAIVKHIVERHRGRLDIGSVVGTGTTVRVLLPAARALSLKSHELVTQSEPNGPGKVIRPV